MTHLIEIESVDSGAWRVLKQWACSLPKIDLFILASFSLAPELMQRPEWDWQLYDENDFVQDEANSIIFELGPLTRERVSNGVPALRALSASEPRRVLTISDPKVMVTTLIDVICD